MQTTLIIKNALVQNTLSDIFIAGSRIVSVAPAGSAAPGSDDLAAARVIDASGMAAFPGLVNCHTHAAMTIFRGYGDDMPLQQWLTTKIWPNEANLDDDSIYWGTRLACLEMIKSGTVCFNDMYFFPDAVARAVTDSGLRALVQPAVIGDDLDRVRAMYDGLESLSLKYNATDDQGDWRVRFCVAPHAVYTVGEPMLKWIGDWAEEHAAGIHVHVSETEQEVADCLRQWGETPVARLDRIGLLRPDTVAAHCVWLNDDDVKIMGDRRVNVCHCPNSNLKLGSGYKFLYSELCDAGANVCLGTDGCSSSNNLDMIEAAKVMTLLQKGWRRDTSVLPATEALKVATVNGANAMGIDSGSIEAGKIADIMLVDLSDVAFVPNNDSLSNLIYAAHGNCVDTLICGGRVLMQGRHAADEEIVRNEVRRVVKKVIKN